MLALEVTKPIQSETYSKLLHAGEMIEWSFPFDNDFEAVIQHLLQKCVLERLLLFAFLSHLDYFKFVWLHIFLSFRHTQEVLKINDLYRIARKFTL